MSTETARFEDEGEVARGGMSSIHRVVDLRLARREAMKVLEMGADAGTERGRRSAQRFVEEARITGQLDHPNIVPIYDLGLLADGSPAFITMKLVEGDSFQDWLDRLGDDRLESECLEQAIQILVKVCDAVSFAHGRGVVHCDIKPANIMVGSFGQVYLMDWGLSVTTPVYAGTAVKGWAPRPMRPGTIAGSPAFMSPEQANGLVDQIDERTDVFGLGATLYRVLTGQAPYVERSVKATVLRAQAGEPKACESVVSDARLPPVLCRIAMKAMATDPAQRYPGAAALKADLEGFLRGGGWLPSLSFAAGELIVREGEEARAAYVLEEGLVEVFKTVGDTYVPLRLMGPGEVFGEAAVFSSKPRSASVVAKSDVVVRVITAESLERELSKNVSLKALVRALAHASGSWTRRWCSFRWRAGGSRARGSGRSSPRRRRPSGAPAGRRWGGRQRSC
ncbi:MAG: cyclic nucleotide-binding domain-containing protein [Polyangiaceae bacterium]